MTQATWTSPLSNRVLLEAGFSRFQYLWAGFGIAPPDALTNLIPVTESQAIDDHRANFTYRGTFDPLGFGWANNDANPNNWRASMAYVTGAHNLKVGYQGSYQRSLQARDANTTLLRYTMNNRALNGVSYTLATRWEQNDRTATTALYVQDQWTMGRVTLQGALRYDRASSWAPAEDNGTTEISRFNPAPITLPAHGERGRLQRHHDAVGRRLGRLRQRQDRAQGQLGKYLQNATNDENYTANNPAARIQRNVLTPARAWQDNGNFIVDCDLRNPAAQNNLASGGDSCGALTGDNANFGNANPNLDDRQPGHSARAGACVPATGSSACRSSRSCSRGVSLDVSYNRRWFQNFFVDDNQLVGPSDYTPWTFTAPQHPDLPGGGGYPVTVYSRLRGDRRADLPDVRDRLRRRAHAVLAWRERVRQRAAAQRPHVPGRDEHRPRRARHVRHEQEPSRDNPRNGHGHVAIDTSCSVPRDRAGDDVVQGALPRTPCRRSTCSSAHSSDR